MNINESLQLHLVGALQTNKVDKAVNIFSYIHSLDRIKLADKLKDEEIKQKKNSNILFKLMSLKKSKSQALIMMAPLPLLNIVLQS